MLSETRERAAELHLPALALAGHFELCYAMCRLLRPKIAVETGVGYGWTTIFILLALEKNGVGHLHSVELAAFAPSSK
jgi:predicted O-methyltransferase YrrM